MDWYYENHNTIEVTSMTQQKFLIAVAFALSAPMSVQACEHIRLLQPQVGETVSSLRPELVWETGDSAEFTRLQILSYIPEGGVLKTVDIATQDNFFRPNVDLTKSRAAVKVLISRNCTDKSHESLLAQPASFFINNSETCSVPTGPKAVLRDGYAFISWNQSLEATGYESYISAPNLGAAPVFKAEEGLNHLSLPAPGIPSLLKLRSLCPAGTSKWISVGLTPTR